MWLPAAGRPRILYTRAALTTLLEHPFCCLSRYAASEICVRLPMPGLVFICLPSAQAPYVFAAKSRPRAAGEDLYHAPTFNVFRDGRVCPGTHVFPRDPGRMPEEFFRSHFSPAGDTTGRSRSHPDDLLGLWADMDRQKEVSA